jgi:hypothetical protein
MSSGRVSACLAAALALALEFEETVGITIGSIDWVILWYPPRAKKGHLIDSTNNDPISSKPGSQQEFCSPDQGFGALGLVKFEASQARFGGGRYRAAE